MSVVISARPDVMKNKYCNSRHNISSACSWDRYHQYCGKTRLRNCLLDILIQLLCYHSHKYHPVFPAAFSRIIQNPRSSPVRKHPRLSLSPFPSRSEVPLSLSWSARFLLGSLALACASLHHPALHLSASVTQRRDMILPAISVKIQPLARIYRAARRKLPAVIEKRLLKARAAGDFSVFTPASAIYFLQELISSVGAAAGGEGQARGQPRAMERLIT